LSVGLCFEDFAKFSKIESRSISAENPLGKKGKGGSTASPIGVGRKGRPAVLLKKGGEVQTIAEIKGPGCLRHIWMTLRLDPRLLRGALIRIYWDERSYPSVEVPLGDFFGVAHGRTVPYASLLTAMVEGRGLNTWIPMPFKEARIELVNESPFDSILFYQIDYTLGDDITDKGRLCCTFRRENPTSLGTDFTILERVEGRGRFLGAVVGVRTLAREWWGEGEIKMYLNGDKEYPTICGTGTEDYILSAWGVGQHTNIYQGTPLSRQDLISFYRWHVLDPLYFKKDIRVTMQQIGAGKGGLIERSDDWSAAAFFYVDNPRKLPKIPSVEERLTNITEKRDSDMQGFLWQAELDVPG
jgi:hypothetical protein